MSGAISASTIIAGIGAAAAVGSTVYGIKAGQDQASAQSESLKRQNTAQQQAEASALSTQRKSETAQNAANMQTPDLASILKRAATAGSKGLSSTMLTGPTGVDANQLDLGKTTLLGQ